MASMTSAEAAQTAKASPQRSAAAPKAGATHLVAIGFGFASLLGALLIVGVVPRMRDNRALAEAAIVVKQSVPTVAVTRPQRAGATSLSLPGSVQAFQETEIYARTNGYLDRPLVDIGDTVQAGDLLGRISAPEVDQQLNQARAQLLQAQANLQQAQASLDKAQRDWDRARSLGPSDALSQTQYDTYQSAYEVAKAGVAAARAALVAGQANVEQLRELQAFQKVTAPFAGVITDRHVDAGALINAGSASSAASLFKLSQIDVLRVFVNVPQSSVAAIRVGQEATIEVREFPDRPFKGEVARTTHSLDAASRTLSTEVDVPNADLALLPGMYVQVRFDVTPPGIRWRVPASTVTLGPAGTQVAVVTPENTVRYQNVAIAKDLGSEIEVTSGLSGQETLVRTPSAALPEGTKVQIATDRS